MCRRCRVRSATFANSLRKPTSRLRKSCAKSPGTPTASPDGVQDEAPAVELVEVTVGFGERTVLERVNLAIRPHAITLIVGASGSGKTVLLKTMLGLIRPRSGTVRLLGRDLAEVSEVELVELRRHVAMLFQNYALFDGLSVQDNVEFPLQQTPAATPDIHRVALAILSLLGLAGNEALLPGELSGGMKKRVGLARALVGHPELVLFDEPTTGLDPIMVEHVDRLIAKARHESEVTAVIVSHDLASVRRLADRVAFLDGGTIAFEGSCDEFFHSELPAIRKLLEVADLPRTTTSTPVADQAPVIELIDVHKAFGDKQVLRGVNLQILPKQITVLLGASGSGKSVIAKHVMGLLKPDRGEIIVFGTDIVPLSERELLEVRLRFGLVFQSGALLDWLSVEDNVAFPLREHPHGHEIRARVTDILHRLDLDAVARRLPAELSAGERKRVALARALVGRPDVVIYDEPTTGQDSLRAFEIDELIQRAQQQFGVTSLVISHDLTSTFRIAHRVAMLHEGTVIAYGTPAEIQASTIPYVQEFLHAATG